MLGKVTGRCRLYPGHFSTNQQELVTWAAKLVARNIPCYQPKAGSRRQRDAEKPWDLSVVLTLAHNITPGWQRDSLGWLRPAKPSRMCKGTLCQWANSSATSFPSAPNSQLQHRDSLNPRVIRATAVHLQQREGLASADLVFMAECDRTRLDCSNSWCFCNTTSRQA